MPGWPPSSPVTRLTSRPPPCRPTSGREEDAEPSGLPKKRGKQLAWRRNSSPRRKQAPETPPDPQPDPIPRDRQES